ncbi:MAG: NHLP bacteriocin export ABC transporter permease/ATPase subunit [Rubrobacteraceae bacterium]
MYRGEPTPEQAPVRLLEKIGSRVEVGGDKPVPLDDRDSLWVVLSGRVDVFSVPATDGRITGSRQHICRIEAGEAFFGIDPRYIASEGLELLAVGAAGTSLLSLDRPALVDAAQKGPEHTLLAAALLDGWIRGLSAAAVGETPRPEDVEVLEPGREVNLEPGGSVGADKDQTLWLRHLSGTSTFLGGAASPAIAVDNDFFPLSAPAWLEADDETASRLEILNTEDYLRQDEGSLNGLDAFYTAVVPVLAYNARLAEDARRGRMLERAETDRELALGAVRQLGSVTQSHPTETVGIREVSGVTNPLLAACRLVGGRLEIELREPEEQAFGDRAADPIEEISRASRVRTRRVRLRDGWWRRDGGPLLAFQGEEERPVALLPKSATAYELVDPADGTQKPVDGETAEGLQPHAYTFYAPFPHRPLGVRDLLAYSLRGLRKDLLRVLLMGIAGGLLGALVPIATKVIVQTAIPQAEERFAVVITLGLTIGAVAAMLFGVVSAFVVLRIETRMDTSIQSAVWDRLLSLPAPFFRGYSAGDLAARAMGINTIRQMVTGPTISSILSGLFSLFSFGVVFYYSVTLGLLATLMVVFIAIVTVFGGYVQLRYARRTTQLQGEVSSLMLQLLTGVAKLRVAGAEKRAFAVWADRYARQRENSVKSQAASNALLVFGSASGILTSMVVFAFVAYLAAGNLSTSDFVAFNAAFAQFLVSSAGITSSLTTILQAAPYYERAKPILNTLPEVESEKPDPGELSGRIRVSHVSFRYAPESPLVLDDVSLEAEAGEFVAVVGPSGAGKSSLLRVLLGFEEPELGTVYYDDHELPAVDVQAVRHQMGVVLQDGKLMPGTIYHNIVGVSQLTVDDAWEAAYLVGLGEDIEAMPMGMFTILSEGATTISGGQRQRLMIARAIARRPRILLFDEATSALDNQTQAIVSESLEKLQVTRIVIAHRLSTIINADRIYVLQNGRIVQSGTYEELIAREGTFRDLATRQIA